MKIAVPGTGMVGSTIAIDLSLQHEVTSLHEKEKNIATLK